MLLPKTGIYKAEAAPVRGWRHQGSSTTYRRPATGRDNRGPQDVAHQPEEFARRIDDFLISVGPATGRMLHLLAIGANAKSILMLGPHTATQRSGSVGSGAGFHRFVTGNARLFCLFG